MPRPKLKSDDEVLEAATAVLKRCGPINFTLSEVANEVGLSRAALIQRFTNRDTLLVRMMERSVGQVRVHLDAMPAGAGPWPTCRGRWCGQQLQCDSWWRHRFVAGSRPGAPLRFCRRHQPPYGRQLARRACAPRCCTHQGTAVQD